jgi:Lipocalin-like domain
MKLASLGFAAVLLATQSAMVAAQGGAPRLVGTWRLVAATQRMIDGTERPDPNVGAHARGYIIYTPTGRMCAMLGNSERPHWAVADRPTAEEALTISANMVAYCGTYKVDEAGGFVLHHVELDLSPNRGGTDRKRFFTISGDRLVLRPARPLPEGVRDWTVTWERVR